MGLCDSRKGFETRSRTAIEVTVIVCSSQSVLGDRKARLKWDKACRNNECDRVIRNERSKF
jgi:hypothetical protein